MDEAMSARNPRARWSRALASEKKFWTAWLEHRGLDWKEEFEFRLQADSELQPEVAKYLVDVTGPDVVVLDLGAGPLTQLGKRLAGRNLHIQAIDPLADSFDELLANHRLVAPVATTWCHGELLEQRFAPETFDLVWSLRAADCAYHPDLFILNSLVVAKCGGRVVLTQPDNGAAREGYRGLRQWNFSSDERGHFVIWNRSFRIDMTERLSRWATVLCYGSEGWVTIEMTKLRALEVDRQPEAVHTLAARLRSIRKIAMQALLS